MDNLIGNNNSVDVVNSPAPRFKLTLNYVTTEDTFLEHESIHSSHESALEEADDVAFQNVGFPLEDWGSSPLDFGNGNVLFVFYPNEVDKTSRYRLSVTAC